MDNKLKKLLIIQPISKEYRSSVLDLHHHHCDYCGISEGSIYYDGIAYHTARLLVLNNSGQYVPNQFFGVHVYCQKCYCLSQRTKLTLAEYYTQEVI